MANTLNLDEIKNVVNYIIDNNKVLREAGKKATALGLEGPCGCGKTSIIEEIAKERGMTYVYVSLAECEEIGDITGFPLKEFKINKLAADGSIEKTLWAAHDILPVYLNSSCAEYEVTGETRLAYAAPAWLPKEDNPNGCILLLDDYTRKNN